MRGDGTANCFFLYVFFVLNELCCIGGDFCSWAGAKHVIHVAAGAKSPPGCTMSILPPQLCKGCGLNTYHHVCALEHILDAEVASLTHRCLGCAIVGKAIKYTGKASEVGLLPLGHSFLHPCTYIASLLSPVCHHSLMTENTCTSVYASGVRYTCIKSGQAVFAVHASRFRYHTSLS